MSSSQELYNHLEEKLRELVQVKNRLSRIRDNPFYPEVFIIPKNRIKSLDWPGFYSNSYKNFGIICLRPILFSSAITRFSKIASDTFLFWWRSSAFPRANAVIRGFFAAFLPLSPNKNGALDLFTVGSIMDVWHNIYYKKYYPELFVQICVKPPAIQGFFSILRDNKNFGIKRKTGDELNLDHYRDLAKSISKPE